MYTEFLFSVLGAVGMMPIHFLSVEHLNLQEKFGKENGRRIGEVLGLISGWGFFIFWAGIWLSPQPRFLIPIFQNLELLIPVAGLIVPFLHIVISAPFLIVGPWLAIKSVQEMTLKVAETHRPETLLSEGSYTVVRHPQYLGGLLAHIGISFLVSAWLSLLSTPLMVALIYLLSKKEEKELIREFGDEYRDYARRVPMLVPRLKSRH